MAEGVRNTLQEGDRVRGYAIQRTLGAGTFGNVYLCTDTQADETVALREYMPRGLTTRSADGEVVPQSAAAAPAFEQGLARFVARAERMAQIAHPNLAAVRRVFLMNGTAYVAMDYAAGEPLTALLSETSTLPPDRLAACLRPVIDALAAMHEAGIAHANIGPGSIILGDDGTPILLGLAVPPRDTFGTVGKPGYAPIEHYSTTEDLGGVRADVYSMGAVLYRCVTGAAPPEPTVRAERDTLVPAARAAARGRYSRELLAAITDALALQPDDRSTGMDDFRRVLDIAAQAESEPGAAPRPSPGGRRNLAIAGAVGAAIVAGVLFWQLGGTDEEPAPAPTEPPEAEAPPIADVEPAVPDDAVEYPAPDAPAIADVETPAVEAPELPVEEPIPPTEEEAPLPVEEAVAVEDAPEALDVPALLFVETTPSGAQVLVDGQAFGETPVEYGQLPPGTVVVTLTHPDYETLELPDVELAAGEATRIDRELVRATGSLLLSTGDVTAWIEVDGERLAETTPATVALPAGVLGIAVGADGYVTAVEEVSVTKGGTAELVLELERATGSLTLVLTPPDAEVALADVDEAYRPGMPLPAGRHELTVTREGYLDVQTSVQVAGATTLELALEPLLFPFTIFTDPPGAVVGFEGDDRPYEPGMSLPPAEYRVQVTRRGYAPWTGGVDHGVGPTTYAVSLDFVTAEYADPLVSGGEGPVMAVVPAGSFRMGCLADAGCPAQEGPVREVSFAAPFSVSKHEVTFDDFERFWRATGGQRPDDNDWGRDQRPVINVSWDDAMAYAAWLSEETGRRYALPSEAEWEYAARAGTETPFAWGATAGGDANCDDCGRSRGRTVEVGSYRGNDWGLQDMHGNVWEWVADCWNGSHDGMPTDGAARIAGDCGRRVLRGGSWFNAESFARSASRLPGQTTTRGVIVGFRVTARDE